MLQGFVFNDIPTTLTLKEVGMRYNGPSRIPIKHVLTGITIGENRAIVRHANVSEAIE
jgi:hypothetical protein